MTTQHIQTENRSFSSIVLRRRLHRSIIQIQVLCTCLHENHHKEYQGRRAKGSSGTSHHQRACRRMPQTKLPWERLTSSVKCVWWLIHCLCSPIHNRKAVCMLERAVWLFGLFLFVCLASCSNWLNLNQKFCFHWVFTGRKGDCACMSISFCSLQIHRLI